MPSVGGFDNLDIIKNVLLPSVGSFNNHNDGRKNNASMPSVGHFCNYNITLSFVGFHASYLFWPFWYIWILFLWVLPLYLFFFCWEEVEEIDIIYVTLVHDDDQFQAHKIILFTRSYCSTLSPQTKYCQENMVEV